MSSSEKPPIDNPIKSSSEDVLGRADVAHDFAKSLRKLDLSEGLVVGVLGAWGAGKSSFVNLMREEFAHDPKLAVVDFNPWMFSGAQHLVDVFFKEVASELRLKDETKFGKIAEGLDEYGDVLSPIAMIPVVGAWWDRSHRAYKAARKWWKERGAQPLRKKVADALASLDQPVVVVVDDIDRLSTEEIRDIFKLVRLTASFPNVIYVLAFDRKRVEAALDETNVPGRAYLEKIVQLSFDLPVIPREMLRSEVFERLNPILDSVTDVRFDQDNWPDVFFEIVEPLIGSLRDVTRLALSARSTIEALGSEIETVDLVALEAIRVFRPEIFEQLQIVRGTLTGVTSPFGDSDSKRQRDEIDKLIEVADNEAEIVRDLIRRVFPAARRYTDNTHYGHDSASSWKRDHRVAHLDYLNLYFERTAPSGIISFRRAEKAYAMLTDGAALGAYLDGLKPEDLEDTISGLEAYEHSYPLDAIAPASITLLNRIGSIPDRDPRGFFDVSRPDIVVGRVVVRMLRRIENEADREAVVKEILAGLTSYSTQRDFIRTVHADGAGHKLIGDSLARDLEDEFVERAASTHSPVPKKEWDLLRVYWMLVDRKGDEFESLIFSDPDEIRSLFKSARSVAQSQSFDSRKVHQEEHLQWDPLVRILGSEEAVKAARDILNKSDGETPLVKLVDKYLGGWRPSRD